MRSVVLYFPEAVLLSDFLLHTRVRGAEVNSLVHSLTATLSDEQIRIACTEYRAYIETMDVELEDFE